LLRPLPLAPQRQRGWVRDRETISSTIWCAKTSGGSAAADATS
jgi:hypothetical protein